MCSNVKILFSKIKNPATFVDELPPDQLLDDDQNMEGLGNGFESSQVPQVTGEDEDLDVDIDIKEEDFESIPYVGGEISFCDLRRLPNDVCQIKLTDKNVLLFELLMLQTVTVKSLLTFILC